MAKKPSPDTQVAAKEKPKATPAGTSDKNGVATAIVDALFSKPVDQPFQFQVGVLSGPGNGPVTLTITCLGGPTAQIQIAVFDKQNVCRSSVGFAGGPPPLSTAASEKPVDWTVATKGCSGGYVKLNYAVLRSAASLPAYVVSTQLRQNGQLVATATRSGEIPAGSTFAPPFVDGFTIQ